MSATETDTYIVPSDEEIRAKAKAAYEIEGEIEIDAQATISISEDHIGPQGAYVQAWVYVAFDREDA